MYRIGEHVGGWFHGPYRTVSQVLLSADKSPGIGLGLRELYNRGFGKEHTNTGTILEQASPLAKKIYDAARSIGHDHPGAIDFTRKGLASLGLKL